LEKNYILDKFEGGGDVQILEKNTPPPKQIIMTQSEKTMEKPDKA
jgi:hypothetical protein